MARRLSTVARAYIFPTDSAMMMYVASGQATEYAQSEDQRDVHSRSSLCIKVDHNTHLR